jgi:hypothetical protein
MFDDQRSSIDEAAIEEYGFADAKGGSQTWTELRALQVWQVLPYASSLT